MLLPKQIWKDIPRYEGKYQVSNTGKVRSLNYKRTGKTKILKPHTNRDGYKTVNLLKPGEKYKPYYVHRLVAQAFIPNPNNWPQVNHIDEDKANNVVWNLEWCTQQYNMNYGTRNERAREALKYKTIILRVSPQDKLKYKNLAKEAGMPLQDFLAQVLYENLYKE